MEADVIPGRRPERAIEIDGAMGELSPFHTTFGYYAHGVSVETAVLPAGWRERLVAVSNANTRGMTGWCLAPVDLAASKLAAGRDKDIRFVAALLRHGLVAITDIRRVASDMPIQTRERIELNLARCEPAV